MKKYYVLKSIATLVILFQVQSFSSQIMRDYKPGIIRELSKAEEIELLTKAKNKEATTCAGTTAVAYSVQTCADVGTAAFYTNAPTIVMANSAATVPTVAETCTGAAGYDNGGTWLQLNPGAGADILDMQITGGGLAGGNYTGYIQFFQGTSCAALTSLGCMPAFIVTMGIRAPLTIHQEGINPAQNVWAYIWNDGGKGFSLNTEVIGSSATTVTNDACASASTTPSGCNLGAGPETTWTGPSNNGKACSGGGTWYSNENTVYFTITAGTGTTGSISVNPIVCNNGVAGEAQFAVFNSCACVGTYTAACYRSCAVGTGTLSLSSLTPGATYTLAVDGQAGDICKWTFITTGIILPVEMLSFSAKSITGGNRIFWNTASELNTDYFEIQHSTDGENFTNIARFKGAGTKSTETEYEYLDTDFEPGKNYYRLKQMDLNGEVQYFVPAIVNNEFDGHYVYPNPVNDEALVVLGSSSEGTASIVVVDATGKEIYRGSESVVKGMNDLKINTADFKAGMYYVTITNDKESKTLKFTK